MTESTPKKPAAAKAENSVPPVEPETVESPYAVVGDGDTDPVYLSRAEYKSKTAKRSLTMHHVQRRLNELGYTDAYADRDGWYGELTASGVSQFQKDQNFEVTGRLDQGTFMRLFSGDSNVTVYLT